MPRGGKTYTTYPTETDRIITVMHLSKGIVQDFTVQYETLIGGVWTEVNRIDTCHGDAHQHKFNPSGKEVKIGFFCNDYKEGLTNAKKYITENFTHIRNNYLTQAAKRRL